MKPEFIIDSTQHYLFVLTFTNAVELRYNAGKKVVMELASSL